MNASFRQKSAGVSLVIIAALAAYYFSRVIGFLRADAPLRTDDALPAGFGTLVVITIFLIAVVEAALQAVLAIGAGSVPAATQRDREIASLAQRNAYAVLAPAALIAVGVGLFWSLSAFALGNLLLFGFVLAEIVRLASQMVYARVGAAEAVPSRSRTEAEELQRRSA